jgi:hypothetical protein
VQTIQQFSAQVGSPDPFGGQFENLRLFLIHTLNARLPHQSCV